MIFGVTPLLSVIRNFLKVSSFCALFLCLDRPRYSWKRTWMYYGAYILAQTAIGTAWVLLDAESYAAGSTTVLFVESAVFSFLMSSDTSFSACTISAGRFTFCFLCCLRDWPLHGFF